MVLSFVKLPYTSAQALLQNADDFIHPVPCSVPSAKRYVTDQEPGPCTQETFSYGRAGTVAACRNQAPGNVTFKGAKCSQYAQQQRCYQKKKKLPKGISGAEL